MIEVSEYLSPCGVLTLGTLDGALCLCDWNLGSRRERVDSRLCREFSTGMERGDNEVLRAAKQQLDEYFRGERRAFDVRLAFAGSELRHQVWEELQKIPYGTTISYSELARRIGRPTAIRAVASAVGANPLSIFIPCHRVIGHDGSLTGYAGGLEVKRRLIELEG